MTDAVKKRYYLAGPMTGYPKFNYPMFDTVAAGLRDAGWDIVSPAELDDPAVREQALASPDGRGATNGHTWGDFLSRDVKIIADQCQGVLLLPHWENSRGARLEAFVGLLCGHEFKTVCLLHSGDTIHSLALLPGDKDDIMRCLSKVPATPDVLEDFRQWLNDRWGPADVNDEKRVAITALGLAGETGEVVEHFKKFLRDGKDLHSEDLLLELGDQLHYWMRACELAGFTPAEVIEANKAKLTARDALKAAAAQLDGEEQDHNMEQANG